MVQEGGSRVVRHAPAVSRRGVEDYICIQRLPQLISIDLGMSQRPLSAGPSRPSSSLSRPSSAASQRTLSRASHRPFSRLSQRPLTRQSRALCHALVTKLTGLVADKDGDFDDAYDIAIRRIEAIGKQAAAPDLQTALKQLRG